MFVLEYTEDKVANIRLLAIEAIMLLNVYAFNRPTCLQVVKQIRSVFKKENDTEVIYHIKLAHKKLKKYL